MGDFKSFVLCLVSLMVLASAKEEAYSLMSNSSLHTAVSRASAWMLSKREEDFSWGPFTPRAVVALEMSSEVTPLPPLEQELLIKQLNILLTLELGKDVSTKDLSLSRLALFVNALLATCQNPRHFHGLDLVRTLRKRVDSSSPSALLPIVYLSLCMAGETHQEDLRVLGDMFRRHTNKTDMQAIDIMALSCLGRQKGALASYKSYVNSYLQVFTDRFLKLSPTADVYTLALGFQAILSGGGHANISSLVQKQLADGSFGSLLATYLSLPVLLGKSLVDLHCKRKDFAADLFASPSLSQDGALRVHYSLWIGEEYERDSHTITVTVRSPNATFLDVMRVAAEKNPTFKFLSQESKQGRRVYLIASTPNDVELELYWTLYRTRDGPNGANPRRPLQLITGGLDKIYPSSEDHFVFWFKRRSCSLTESSAAQCAN